jgi:hypothetical protein
LCLQQLGKLILSWKSVMMCKKVRLDRGFQGLSISNNNQEM